MLANLKHFSELVRWWERGDMDYSVKWPHNAHGFKNIPAAGCSNDD